MSLEERILDFEEKPGQSIFLLIIFIMALGAAVSAIGYVLGWYGETAQVAQQEFGPKAALAKYEWFKDAAAQLEAKQANIGVYKTRMTTMEQSYTGKTRVEWVREDREQFNVWSSEVAGAVASYNNLAAEYNAAMVKFNWRFANAGDLPPGADKPLPREFKPYETK